MKLGIVFSGGIAKGAYQLGFCKALNEFSNKFDLTAISASSIGCLNAYALASDKISIAEELWLNINLCKYTEFIKRIIRRLEIYDYIDKICLPIDKLNCNLYISLCNGLTENINYIFLNNQSFEKRLAYLKASISILPLMKPVKIDNKKWYDGAIIENVPINGLSYEYCDLVIVLQFDNYISNNVLLKNKNCNIIYFNMCDNNIFLKSSFILDTSTVRQMINDGYSASKEKLGIILNGGDLENEIYLNTISQVMNNSLGKSKLNGDTIMRKVNKFLSI